MFELENIFVGVDSSRESRAGLAVSKRLAAVFKATVTSTHVVPRVDPLFQRVLFPYAAMGEDLAEFEHELIATARRQMTKLFGDGTKESESSGHPSVVVCQPVLEGLREQILKVGPDLVTLGVRGDAVAHTVGSTALNVAEGWDGPLLLVRDELDGDFFSGIVAFTDLGPGSDQVIGAALVYALKMGLPLDILTVLSDPRLNDPAGLMSKALRVDPEGILAKGRRSAKRQLEQILSNTEVPFPEREAYSAVKPRHTVRFGDPVEELKQIVGAKSGTLVILRRRIASPNRDESTGIGRTAEAVLRRVPAHVMLY